MIIIIIQTGPREIPRIEKYQEVLFKIKKYTIKIYIILNTHIIS